MTAPAAAAPRVIDVVRNDVLYLDREYTYEKGMKNTIVYNGKQYTVTPVCKNRDGNWVQAPGFSRGMYHCDHCGDHPGGNYWEYKNGENSIVLNDADIHQIDKHAGDVSVEKAKSIFNFFNQDMKLL